MYSKIAKVGISNYRIGKKELAGIMQMSEDEISFFSKTKDIQQLVMNYRQGSKSKGCLIEDLENIAINCLGTQEQIFFNGIEILISHVRYSM